MGIAPTITLPEIRRAYAVRLRSVNPEDDAIGFQILRNAYERAVQAAVGTTVGYAEDASGADDRDPVVQPNSAEPKVEEKTAVRFPEEAWTRLSDLLAGPHEPSEAEMLALLQSILAPDVLENVGAHARIERRLAALLAKNTPRSDALIEPAEAAFNWFENRRDVALHPAIPVLLNRGIFVRHTKLLAAIQRVFDGADSADETQFEYILAAAVSLARRDYDLSVHAENLLARMIVRCAPRADRCLDMTIERLNWEPKRRFDVAAVLRRRNDLRMLAELRAGINPRSWAFAALNGPPDPAEYVIAMLSPGRHDRIQNLLTDLQTFHLPVLDALPRSAVEAWNRYFRLTVVHPSVLTAVILFGALLLWTRNHPAAP